MQSDSKKLCSLLSEFYDVSLRDIFEKALPLGLQVRNKGEKESQESTLQTLWHVLEKSPCFGSMPLGNACATSIRLTAIKLRRISIQRFFSFRYDYKILYLIRSVVQLKFIKLSEGYNKLNAKSQKKGVFCYSNSFGAWNCKLELTKHFHFFSEYLEVFFRFRYFYVLYFFTGVFNKAIVAYLR